ncbi:hypothetical protein [Flavobacterium sp. '19STA2R22 D10 B1']|uniref:hypothetical protein n=1 Tax=Flavobacterium aerium TaxID=3037261 RepID=UPI00278C7916|nr:hypothetical protein [Flavobacterium sp. '19STA2R22 D10 B1']
MRRWILKKNAKSLDDLVMEETVIPVPQKGEVRVWTCNKKWDKFSKTYATLLIL